MARSRLANRRAYLGYALAALFLLFLASYQAVPDVDADSLLVNGDFESGSDGWTGISGSGCGPRSGSGAGNISTSGFAEAKQWVGMVGHGGSYTLSGYVRLQSGSATGTANIFWYSGESKISAQLVSLSPGPAYARFTIGSALAPPSADTLLIGIAVQAVGGVATVCIDDLTLEGPPSETPTPTATPRATDTPAVASATVTTTPTPPAQPKATKTPESSNGAAAPTAPRGTLTNGDFEQGALGWQKYGGELKAVSAPTHGGAGAGALRSSTASTKWAYQVVAVEPGGGYELAAYLLPGPGVADAYLRISWFASGDGSGRAIATSDSTRHAALGTSAYQLLTTGAVAAPVDVHSARVRLVMQPATESSATLYMDDVTFGPAEAARAAEPAPTNDELQPTLDGGEVAADAAISTAPQASPNSERTRTPSPARTAEATPRPSVTAQPTAVQTAVEAEDSTVDDAGNDGPGIRTWAAAVTLFAMTSGGSYLYFRKKRRL